MAEPLTVGDTVKHADADDPASIPAYRNMRGEVVAVTGAHAVRVHWSCDAYPEPNYRPAHTVVKAE